MKTSQGTGSKPGCDFEWRAGRVWCALVVPGHDDALAGVFEQDLRRAEHMARWQQCRMDPAAQCMAFAMA